MTVKIHNIQTIDASQEAPTKHTKAPEPRKRKVCFSNVQVHVHDVELGCHPSVSSGPPIELSWNRISSMSYDFHDYERIRFRRRVLREIPFLHYFDNGSMKLSTKERRRRLYRAGFTKSTVKEVELSLQKKCERRNHH